MLDKRTLARINDRPQGRGSATYTALGVAVVVAVVALLISYALATAVLLVGAAVVFLLDKRNAEVQTVKLTYNLSGEMAEKFAAFREACGVLTGAERVWRVEGRRKIRGRPLAVQPSHSARARSGARSRSVSRRCPASRRT
ncbi:MAG: hypothetical protein H0X71_09055 [Rubrobacter sp.]|nr:hypothetical protein [Rubrobacter sp.]